MNPPAESDFAPDFAPPPADVREAVERALAEDIGPDGDLTAALLPPETRALAQLASRSNGILAGTACAQEAFALVDVATELTWHATDGDTLKEGQAIAEVSGSLASICTTERVALNFLGHLSGIATHTRAFVEAAGGVAVFDTRKTTPGLRSLEKAAVRAGGGNSHRASLSEFVMLKDNHLSVLGIAEAVGLARSRWPDKKVQVECDTIDQAREAIKAGADALLLDNMTPEQVADVMEIVNVQSSAIEQADTSDEQVLGGSSKDGSAAGRSKMAAKIGAVSRCYVEASGGITLENIAAYGALGIDAVSSGALIGGAEGLDIGLDVLKVWSSP